MQIFDRLVEIAATDMLAVYDDIGPGFPVCRYCRHMIQESRPYENHDASCIMMDIQVREALVRLGKEL